MDLQKVGSLGDANILEASCLVEPTLKYREAPPPLNEGPELINQPLAFIHHSVGEILYKFIIVSKVPRERSSRMTLD